MTRRDVTACVLTVRLLIIKKNVGTIRGEKRRLRQAAEKNRLINADIPSTQRSSARSQAPSAMGDPLPVALAANAVMKTRTA